MKILYSLTFLFLTALLFSNCKKNEFNLKDNIYIDNKASLKINFFSAYSSLKSYQIKIDTVRVSNLLTYATPFPGGGLNTGGGSYADYLAVSPGSHDVRISLPYTGTNIDSVVLGTATVNVTADKKYSLYFADTATNTSSFTLEDNMQEPDSGYCKYRFTNLISDLASGYDLYFGTGATSTTSTKVAGPVKYKESSDYFTIPLGTGTIWSIRPAGAANTTAAIASYTSASSIVNQRIFTVTTRGYAGVTVPTTDIRIPKISLIYNR